jgi:glycosyltransferase involved in cell wall biosynthesis
VRICVIGKFPPIQGGVSMRTYWTAHRLAARGHEVHVVTNAKEVSVPFRMHMRPQDWQRCEAVDAPGSVTVHWSDPVDRSQSYIPMASPFVSKLAGIAARVHTQRPFDLIYSHYLEPYGIAAYLAAQMTGVPHAVRMAGSDAGRLWHHPQLEPLYDHVLRSAALVIAAGTVAERATARGIAADRIAGAGAFLVPEDLFTPNGPVLDRASLRDEIAADHALRDLWWGEIAPGRPHFGVCGKLGDSKGSFPLLRAMQQVARAGLDIGLVALAHGPPETESRFRAEATRLGLADRVLQIPFLPHWRVPDFLRGCLAVCCLEQDFPIGFHAPIIPREVLLCGTCLVASTEMISKLPDRGMLIDGHGCVAIPDVNDTDALAARLASIVRDPQPVAAVGARGRAFARDLQQDVAFPDKLEHLLEQAAQGRAPSPRLAMPARQPPDPLGGRFALTRIAAAELANGGPSGAAPRLTSAELVQAREVLAELERAVRAGRAELEVLAAAVRVEIAIAEAEDGASPADDSATLADSPARLRMRRWAMDDRDVAGLVPVRDPRLRVLAFEFDASEFMGVRTAADLPVTPTPRPSFIVAFRRHDGAPHDPLLVDALTARILMLSDGTRTIAEIDAELNGATGIMVASRHADWIEKLFVQGLVSLQERPTQDSDTAQGLERDLTRAGRHAV